MIWVITIVPAVLCMGAFAGHFANHLKKRDLRPISFSGILVFLNRVYINGLLKLVDIWEEAYERHTHNRAEFVQIQAWRIGEAREYFRKIVANAIALHQFGYRHLQGEDATKKFLARRLINYAIPVKMYGRAGLFTLFICRRLLVLDDILIHIQLPILRHLVDHLLGAYMDLKEAALMLARHAEAGVEVRVAARL